MIVKEIRDFNIFDLESSNTVAKIEKLDGKLWIYHNYENEYRIMAFNVLDCKNNNLKEGNYKISFIAIFEDKNKKEKVRRLILHNAHIIDTEEIGEFIDLEAENIIREELDDYNLILQLLPNESNEVLTFEKISNEVLYK